MKFLLKSVEKGSRLGVLEKTENLKYETPLLLQYTKAASIPFLSHEIFQFITTNVQTIELSIETTYHMENALSIYKKGIASFANFNANTLTYITVKNVGEISPSGHHEKDKLSLFTKAGRRILSPDDYMNQIELHQPDIFHTLCDGDTNQNCSKKRIIKSVERSENFFEACLKRYRTSDILKNSMLIAPIQGGYNIKNREKTIENHLHPDVSGYFLDGFHNNGSTAIHLKFDDLNSIVSKCIELLPQDKIRFMLGAYNPVTLLKLIDIGIDVFDSSYTFLATINQCALTFNFNIDQSSEIGNLFDIDLSADSYKDDFTPILSNCGCLTCQKYSKAYLNHLVNTKELLASILLMIHNIHHYIEFFKHIRLAISNDKLQELMNIVQSQYNTGTHLHRKIEKQSETPDETVKSKRL